MLFLFQISSTLLNSKQNMKKKVEKKTFEVKTVTEALYFVSSFTIVFIL